MPKLLIYVHLCCVCAGFTTSDVACCGAGGEYRGALSCTPLVSMCDDRANYVFWDPYHPSDKANVLLATTFYYGDTNYVRPMNIAQLAAMQVWIPRSSKYTPFKYLLAWLSFPTEYHKYLYQFVSWFLFFPKDFQPLVPEILPPCMPIRKNIWESWGALAID